MTSYTNNAEGGTSGTTVTGANSGGASGDALTVTIGASSALTFDNTHAAHGSLAYQISGGSAVSTFLAKTFTGATSNGTIRMYLYFTANPAAALPICGFYTGSTVCVRLAVSATGKLTLNSPSGGSAAMTSSIPLNQWFRVDITAVLAAGTGGSSTVNRYDSMDSATVSDTFGQSGVNYTGTTDRVRLGVGTNASGALGTFWLDDLAFNDTGAAIGAVPGAASGTASLTLSASGSGAAPASGTASLSLTASASGNGAASGMAALSLTASGADAARASGTASLTLSATGTASAGGGTTIPATHADSASWDHAGGGYHTYSPGSSAEALAGEDGDSFVAYQFTLAVPQGATVTAGPLALGEDGTSLGIPGELQIRAIADDDDGLLAVVSVADADALSYTTASATYTSVGTAGDYDANLPDVAAVIQEIVNRPGWVSGNTITLVVSDNSGPSGSGTFYFLGSGSGFTPTLSATYSSSPGAASGTASLTLSASAAGKAASSGTATLSLTATGAGKTAASGTAALALTGSASSAAAGSGTAALSLSATGTDQAASSGTAALSLTASAPATAGIAGTAALSLTAGATGSASPSGTGTITLTATSSAGAQASGNAFIALTGSTVVGTQAAGTGSITLIATAAAFVAGSGTASIELDASGHASGIPPRDVTVFPGPTVTAYASGPTAGSGYLVGPTTTGYRVGPTAGPNYHPGPVTVGYRSGATAH